MTTEDLQGQVARSAAVERELREEIGKLRAELAEARRHAREYRELYEEAEPSLRARATAAESALAEARGALREAWKIAGESIGDVRTEWSRLGDTIDATAGRFRAALARAGEQEPKCTCIQTETYIENRGNCPEHPAPSRFPDHNSAAGPVWRDPLPEKQLSGSAEPASSGQEAPAAQVKRLRSVLAQIIDLGDANDGPAAVMERLERAISLASGAFAAQPPPATPPPGEQGKGGWEGREIALHRMLEKATVRIEILLGRARACDAGYRTSDGHALSLFEGDSWVEEQRGLLLSTAISHLAPAQPANPAGGVIQPAVGPAQDGAGADLPRSGIPPIDHDFVRNTWPKRDECDKRVSDDGRNSRQCGRPRREHQEPGGGK